ncbi:MULTISPECIES: Tim44/TimA family putative adaptor protein [Thalassospira]|uniref:Tim44/TimA family putative adaptor protein n=1 Tax=Thalassospira TaxID=168934 RepID=UPI0011139B13|nr:MULTISPECIES: Tim44/TimA family putative adaptor protein [Thalassospira]MBL4840363.1 Tim44 domain-containing protein [Thalassospira sp.]MCD1592466.1 Tim44/TimA family putative adaptor protein [Thalassospira xiamenensis]MDM7975892.1 Tim44/TimA family putative adaptor protein [Thalassospira xiamenensis]QPL35600.1 Tim44 domain-containing protein [Thalassospira sp. B30-1]
MQYFDIILFALIAVFLVLRLRNSLGRRNGEEKQGPTDVFGRRSHEDDSKGATNGAPQPTDNVYRLPDADKVVGKDDATVAVDSSAFSVLQQIQKADPDFTQQDFLNGARMAFEMIVEYFAKGDKDGLNPLLSAEVYKNFAAAIDARAEKGEREETTLVGIKSATIHDASLEGRTAYITIKFVSEEVSVILNNEGDVISGDPNQVVEAEDLWTFARNIESRDPNWQLVATETPEEETAQ